jgi:hypothetical protein
MSQRLFGYNILDPLSAAPSFVLQHQVANLMLSPRTLQASPSTGPAWSSHRWGYAQSPVMQVSMAAVNTDSIGLGS